MCPIKLSINGLHFKKAENYGWYNGTITARLRKKKRRWIMRNVEGLRRQEIPTISFPFGAMGVAALS